MAIVGRITPHPMNSAPPIRYHTFVELRCLLCGKKYYNGIGVLIHHPQVDLTPRDPMVVTFCDCYDDTHQTVRIISNDR